MLNRRSKQNTGAGVYIMNLNDLLPFVIITSSLIGAPASWAEDSPYVTLRSLTAPLATQLALAAYEDCTSKVLPCSRSCGRSRWTRRVE